MRAHAWLAPTAVLVLLAAGCVTPAPLETQAADALLTGSGPVPFPPVVRLGEAIEASLVAGTAVRIEAGLENDVQGLGKMGTPRPFDVVLRPSAILGNETWAEVDGNRTELPYVRAYEGEVEGRPESVVRVTMTQEWARGSVRINDTQWLLRMGLNGNLPYLDPLEQNVATSGGRSASGPAPTEAFWGIRTRDYDSAEWNRREAEEQSDMQCLRAHPDPSEFKLVVEPTAGPSALPTLTSRIVMDGDYEYVNLTGRHAFPLQVAFVNEVDAIYQHELGIRFLLVGLHLNTDPEYYPDPLDHAPLRELADFWNERLDVKRDSVHLMTGRWSNYAQANCIGGIGYPTVGYTFTPLVWERDSVIFHIQAFAHELGHIFSAHHHYGNHVEAMWSSGNRAACVPLFGPCVQGGVNAGQAGLATIMIQGYTPGSKPVFGTMEKSVMRGWAEKHLGAHDADA